MVEGKFISLPFPFEGTGVLLLAPGFGVDVRIEIESESESALVKSIVVVVPVRRKGIIGAVLWCTTRRPGRPSRGWFLSGKASTSITSAGVMRDLEGLDMSYCIVERRRKRLTDACVGISIQRHVIAWQRDFAHFRYYVLFQAHFPWIALKQWASFSAGVRYRFMMQWVYQ